jgi:hypothetical protein
MYYAHKIGSDQFLGTMTSVTTSGTTQTTTQDRIFNKTLSHGGFYLQGIVSKRFSLHVQGDIAEKSVYRLQAGAEVAIGKGWSATLDFRTQHYGDYALWTTPFPTNNTWEAFIGFSYRFGEKKIAHEALAYRLLMETNYPIVVQRHTVSSTTKVISTPITILSYTANPTTIPSGDTSTLTATISETTNWTLTIDPSSTGSVILSHSSGTGNTVSEVATGANPGSVRIWLTAGTATAYVDITVIP